jgi:CubicO group peptidase (beta-lactamase class C family)
MIVASPTIRIDTARLRRAAEVVDEAVRQGPYPSGVLVVANSERVLLKHVASQAGKAPAREDGIFLIASITKPIVATAIMRLVEEGRLLLSDPVAKYIPEFALFEKSHVTVRHILTHTSGLDESHWVREILFERRASAVELTRLAFQSWLRYEPGTRYEYNSFSFYILGELIARLGGESYPEYLHRHIFKPLGMRDTSFAPAANARSRAMPVYGDDPDFDRRLAYYTSVAFPGGGLWSTAADLVTFGQAFLRGGMWNGYHLLSPAAIELMTRLHTPGMTEISDGQVVPANYGLGWGKPKAESLASAGAYRHGGITGTQLLVDPEWDMVFVFLSNQWDIKATAPDQALSTVYGALRRA